MAKIAQLIEPKPHDLGDGFLVRRALPTPARRNIGPFVFLDQMGPATITAGKGLDVRPHPHIGLATVTYLYDGEIMHRDSLGYAQPIRPGELNWMSAGRGIVHSERSPDEKRASGDRVFGLQAWVALPRAAEESDPSFQHFGAEALPAWEADGAAFTLIAGEAFGRKSPARTLSPLFYVDVRMAAKSSFILPDEYEEQAVYVASGAALIAGEMVESGRLAVLARGGARICANDDARLMLLGGSALDAPRHVWWNFVSSRKERIEEAKTLWRAGGFDRVPGDDEFIPLPDR
ncbi:MAG: pirin family protein [Hyphomonadaceae bacterium]